MILLCEYLCKVRLLDYLKFIFYGIIQGLTEFIPISSTAHLKVISLLFGINDPGVSFSAIIQLGSVFALLWYFKKNFFYFFKKKTNNSFVTKKLLLSIFIGTIPIVIFGGFIKIFIPDFSNSFLRSNLSIAVISIFMALIMFFADMSLNKLITLKNHTYFNSFLIGISQAFAIIPGVSRSGATISTALLSGWERRDAAKFSFFLGIPAITMASFVEFFSSINEFSKFPFFPLLVGLVTTFFSSLVSIDFLMKYLTNKGLKLFVLYRLIFGILILLNL